MNGVGSVRVASKARRDAVNANWIAKSTSLIYGEVWVNVDMSAGEP